MPMRTQEQLRAHMSNGPSGYSGTPLARKLGIKADALVLAVNPPAHFREVALPLGLVDVKVCAVDATWSGLKLVIRLENRTSR